MRKDYSAAFSLSDRTFPLLAGLVRHPDIGFNFQELGLEEIFQRQIADAAFDLAECTLGSYLMAKARGEKRLTAVPVPLSRRFRQDQLYVAAGSKLNSISDLDGMRVGLPEFQATPAIWLRGIFRNHGILQNRIEWLTYRPERLPIARPPHRGSAKTVAEALLSGEIDCGFSPIRPSSEHFPSNGKNGRLRRLINDPWQADREYFQRLKIFPTTTMLTLRAEAVEQTPALARDIYTMFLAAKMDGVKNLRHTGHLAVMEPFLQQALESSAALMTTDPWPYGHAACWQEIEIFMALMREDDLLDRNLLPGEVFHHSVLDT